MCYTLSAHAYNRENNDKLVLRKYSNSYGFTHIATPNVPKTPGLLLEVFKRNHLDLRVPTYASNAQVKQTSCVRRRSFLQLL